MSLSRVLSSLSRAQVTRALATSTRVLARCQLATQASTRSWLPLAPRFFSTSRVARKNGETEDSSVAPSNPAKTLFVGNLPFSVEASDIRDLFAPFGETEEIRMGMKVGRKMGYAHVDFVNLEDAIAAYESAQEEPFWLQNRTLLLDYAKGLREQSNRRPPPFKVLYFKHFDGDLHTMRTVFKDHAHNILSIDFLTPREPGKSSNHGRITFRSEAEATAALEDLNGKEVENGLKMDLEYGHSNRDGRRAQPRRSQY